MYTKLQNNIKQKISTRSLSVSELERRAGLKQSTIHNILHGRSKNPSIETIKSIAHELNCSIEELIGDSFSSEQAGLMADRSELSEPVVLAEEQEDCPWNSELFIKAVQVIQSILDKKNILLPKKQILASVDEVYKYSIGISEDIDRRFAEWIIEKIIRASNTN